MSALRKNAKGWRRVAAPALVVAGMDASGLGWRGGGGGDVASWAEEFEVDAAVVHISGFEVAVHALHERGGAAEVVIRMLRRFA